MIKQTKQILLLTLFAGFPFMTASAAEWQVDEDESTVRFIGVQEGSGFRGRFENFSAMIDFDPAMPARWQDRRRR